MSSTAEMLEVKPEKSTVTWSGVSSRAATGFLRWYTACLTCLCGPTETLSEALGSKTTRSVSERASRYTFKTPSQKTSVSSSTTRAPLQNGSRLGTEIAVRRSSERNWLGREYRRSSESTWISVGSSTLTTLISDTNENCTAAGGSASHHASGARLVEPRDSVFASGGGSPFGRPQVNTSSISRRGRVGLMLSFRKQTDRTNSSTIPHVASWLNCTPTLQADPSTDGILPCRKPSLTAAALGTVLVVVPPPPVSPPPDPVGADSASRRSPPPAVWSACAIKPVRKQPMSLNCGPSPARSIEIPSTPASYVSYWVAYHSVCTTERALLRSDRTSKLHPSVSSSTSSSLHPFTARRDKYPPAAVTAYDGIGLNTSESSSGCGTAGFLSSPPHRACPSSSRHSPHKAQVRTMSLALPAISVIPENATEPYNRIGPFPSTYVDNRHVSGTTATAGKTSTSRQPSTLASLTLNVIDTRRTPTCSRPSDCRAGCWAWPAVFWPADAFAARGLASSHGAWAAGFAGAGPPAALKQSSASSRSALRQTSATVAPPGVTATRAVEISSAGSAGSWSAGADACCCAGGAPRA
ncbi:hypothetical protein DIPPA_32152 [Diplonema papillatum]|nr:hypothetical protein DIPPA_32152 [Diplonema papillatum]